MLPIWTCSRRKKKNINDNNKPTDPMITIVIISVDQWPVVMKLQILRAMLIIITQDSVHRNNVYTEIEFGPNCSIFINNF